MFESILFDYIDSILQEQNVCLPLLSWAPAAIVSVPLSYATLINSVIERSPFLWIQSPTPRGFVCIHRPPSQPHNNWFRRWFQAKYRMSACGDVPVSVYLGAMAPYILLSRIKDHKAPFVSFKLLPREKHVHQEKRINFVIIQTKSRSPTRKCSIASE